MRQVKWSVMLVTVSVLVGAWFGPGLQTVQAADRPEELGAVDWHRDFEEAKALAEKTGKPMFVLFTEVPGCATVRGYGRRVLGNRFVAEAIEEEFVPVAVYNNVQGEDRRVLKSFGEPSWNNPAVRIIRPDREALAPRLYGDYSVAATVETMVTALGETDGGVPGYVELLHRQHAAAGETETAIFEMYCFWSGEAGLGRLEGVVQTRPGFLEGTEVVEVTYDPDRTVLAELARRARDLIETVEAVTDASEAIVDDATTLAD
ncbi:MAG: thioredoxin family protein, partial [Bradymonadaceae bacterium]